MKLFFVAFALIASAAADVSHLSRGYLPPVQHGHHSGSGSSHYSAVGGSTGFGSSASSHFDAPSGTVSSSGSFGAIGGSTSFGSSSGASAGHGGSVSYSSHQHNHDYGHEEPSQAVHVSYDSAPVAPAAEPEQEPEPVAVAPVEDDGAVSYGSYGQDEVQQQYESQYEGAAEIEQQQVDAGVSVANDDAGAAYGGSYDFSSQDAGVQDFDHNSLLTDSYGNNVGAHASHVSLAAAQGPAIRSPQPASFSPAASHDTVQQYVSAGAGVGASSGVETQYGSNGGYIY